MRFLESVSFLSPPRAKINSYPDLRCVIKRRFAPEGCERQCGITDFDHFRRLSIDTKGERTEVIALGGTPIVDRLTSVVSAACAEIPKTTCRR